MEAGPSGNQTANQNSTTPPSDPQASELLIPPDSLTVAEALVWSDLATHAVQLGTLTTETAAAFADLVELRVRRTVMLKAIEKDGYTIATEFGLKAHPLLPQYRGVVQRIEAGMARFSLAPMGKSLGPTGDKPADPFAAFDQADAAADRERTH